MASLPKRGELVTILWPGGYYDFVIKFECGRELSDGWLLLHGLVVEPEGPQHRAFRGFQVRRTNDGGYSLLPMRP